MNDIIGKPLDRVDGRLKVTGQATYAAEFPLENVAYAVTVQSTISRGRIQSIDTAGAEASPGVLAVITHKNMPRLIPPPESENSTVKLGEKNLLPLQSGQIYYDGQHIAVVVAETFEQAEHAARLLNVSYERSASINNFDEGMQTIYQPKESMHRPLQSKRGDVETALAKAQIKLHQTYSTPVYHHNPMEPHATIANWSGDTLTIYDSTQSVMGNRDAVATVLGLKPEDVRLICLFTGGGFGCKGFTWAHSMLAPIAARRVGRPVKLVLSEQQMFTCNGHRGQTLQEIRLGSNPQGKLSAITHDTTTETSFVDEFVETSGLVTQMLYACPNISISHKVVRLNRGTPTPTRAPGEATGTFALECALDELAHQLNVDPIELRLVNHADVDPEKNLPWSEKNLRECYRRGAEAIGWANRKSHPGSVHEGNLLVGYGMATATYPANRVPASAKVAVFADGHAVATSCTQDIGTGTYTVMTQIAAEALGLPVELVEFKLGDSILPKAPVSGGSQTSASVGPAVKEAALTLRNKLFGMAVTDEKSFLYGVKPEDLTAEKGKVFVRGKPDTSDSYAEIIKRRRLPALEAEASTEGTTRATGKKEKAKAASGQAGNIDRKFDGSSHSFHSFGAQFARVLVNPYLGSIRVARCVAVMDIGRVLNLKTATNQIMGGMMFGLGMALMEGSTYDSNRGRILTRDLANYLVPVNADTPDIEVQFIDKPDLHLTSTGARGIGEIGITGITAAIANAVFNATGSRIRDLPITPDKILLATHDFSQEQPGA